MIENFIVSGCSFSAGSSSINQAEENPKVWPDFLLPVLKPKFFINLSIPGSGNLSIANNLILTLETKKNLSPSNSLVVINITGLERIDVMCSVNHPDANKYFYWSKDLGYNWITHGAWVGLEKSSPFYGSLQKNMELEQARTMSCLSIVHCFSYLELHNFKYFFMLMDDYIINDSPAWFTDYLDQRKDKFIKFGQYQSMHSYAKSCEELHTDQFHPSVGGHELIAKHINSFIQKT
jgi:hypothetical protein